MPPHPFIEQATLGDCRSIAEVHVLSWQHAYKDILPAEYLAALSVERREAMWRESIANRQPQVLVARSEGGIDGFAAFGPSRDSGADAHCAELWAIYLAPSAWSRGIGRTLWLASLERMRASSFRSVSLWVLAGNGRAIKFYTAAGFKADATSAKDFTMGGVKLQEVRYVLYSDDQAVI